MKRRLIFSLMLFFCIIGLRAQMNPELPLNPDIIHGTLPNGLNYYILHNSEPKNRANFYIAQRVGSALETEQQLGLAHFLEHMAFNGTTHYPGKTMLDYLQSKGLRFGADINAYTSFDETVYNINNVITTDPALMDSVLLVLYDWSGSILLETDEIEAERGVIEGEYIMGNNANRRMMLALLPALYAEYQYEQLPIGKMEIVKTFPPEVLRAYYKKWYRPDLQGIVIVGDFDAAQMEKKVIDLFSQIPMPDNAAERVYPAISDNEKPIYATFEDPELSSPSINTFFKFDNTPREFRNTLMAYLSDQIIANMVAAMINERLADYAQKPECPYSSAAVGIGSYMFTNQKGSFSVEVTPKDNYVEAYKAAMGLIAQACKTGFMGTEVQRTRDELLAGYETRFKEKDKTDSDVLAREIIKYYIDNIPNQNREDEYNLLVQVLPSIPEEVFNQYASELLHPTNIVTIVTQPSTIGLNMPEEEEILGALYNVIDADYEPYVDEVITEPLISELPKAGSIVSEKENSEFGTKELMLSNGMKVILKPTDYANDEVLLDMFKAGGVACYPSSDAANVQGMPLATETSKIGPFTPTRLNKYLAGKKVNINYGIGKNNNYFVGQSTTKDVNTLFELLYASITEIAPDQESYDATLGQYKTMLTNQESSPMYIFQKKIAELVYPSTPALAPMGLNVLNSMNYNQILNLYKESVKNAADYTLLVVGNFDEDAVKELLKTYVASLPSTGVKNKTEKVSSVIPASGKYAETLNIPAQNPSVYLYRCISQSGMDFTIDNYLKVNMMGQILDMIFTETLREEMGGTYSPSVFADLNPYDGNWALQWYIITSEEMMQPILDRANVEFNKLLAQGTDKDHFNKVREAALVQFENSERSNSFWLNTLLLSEYGFDIYSGQRKALEQMTLEDFNRFLSTVYNGQNSIELVGIAK